MRQILLALVLFFGSAVSARANVRITNATGQDVRVEITSETMEMLHYRLPERAVDSDYGSYGATTVVIRPYGDQESILCEGVYPSGTVLLLDKRQGLYRLTVVKKSTTVSP